MNTPKRVLGNRNIDNIIEVTPLKLPPSPFLEKLGFGTGVNVFRLKRAQTENNTTSPWAVKCLSRPKNAFMEKYSELYTKRIAEEANHLRSLKHPNIVGFRAFFKNGSLAMEDCDGSLGDLLEDEFENGQGPLPVKKINKVIVDISSGLDYLHTQALLLHGDMKSFNVLVKGDFEICKICDFGVSQPVDKEGFLDKQKSPDACYVGTNLWSSPEVIEDPSSASIKSDIFSFGLVIYEMIALQPPHTLNKDVSSIIIISDDDDGEIDSSKEENWERSQNNIEYGTRPSIPDVEELNEEYNPILEAFFVSTSHDPESRPTGKMLYELFKNRDQK